MYNLYENETCIQIEIHMLESLKHFQTIYTCIYNKIETPNSVCREDVVVDSQSTNDIASCEYILGDITIHPAKVGSTFNFQQSLPGLKVTLQNNIDCKMKKL